jgi:hypothetical protein
MSLSSSLGVVWKRVAGAVAMAGAVMPVVACGSGGKPEATATPVAPTAAAMIGRCGSVTDADIAHATGLTGLRQVAVNPLRCGWQTAGGSDYAVIFQWFRGTPLEDRRTQVTLGTPASVQVAGHPGILWSGLRACEIAVASGGEDFIDWILAAGGHSSARPQACSDLEQLAATTLAKAG